MSICPILFFAFTFFGLFLVTANGKVFCAVKDKATTPGTERRKEIRLEEGNSGKEF